MSTALVLNIMAEEKRSLSALMDELPRYYLMKTSVKCPNELKKPVLEALREKFRHLNPLTIDGVKVWYEDGSAILMRPSGTEPIFRLYAEARDEDRVRKLLEEHKVIVEELVRSFSGR